MRSKLDTAYSLSFEVDRILEEPKAMKSKKQLLENEMLLHRYMTAVREEWKSKC
jgi:hypothetical protein